ncbi:hypothetical protein HU200_054917 [Digitaria exilis]|uniref:Glycosyltransferase n=1 Tax=Digitaria exilis TaxID=1010633 RepID=A0A835AUB1_9POAL|nr:hypothetical protein HU200_054917 [Digitaria exilis]
MDDASSVEELPHEPGANHNLLFSPSIVDVSAPRCAAHTTPEPAAMESPPHVAVVAFPFGSHVPHLFAVARALASAAPSATFSFLSTAASLARLPSAAVVPANLRFVEMPSGRGCEGDEEKAPLWRRIEMFVDAAEAGGLRQALETARVAVGGATVTCVVGDALMSMAAEAGVPWVAVWTSSPCLLLAYLSGDALREDIGDHGACDELLTAHAGLGFYRVRDLPYLGRVTSGSSGDMRNVMGLLFGRVAWRLPRAATAIAMNAFPGLFPPDVTAAIAGALPTTCLPISIGPYHLLPGAPTAAPPAQDPHGCLHWLTRHPARAVAYVSFGTVAAPQPGELRELAFGLEASGAPFLWSLREDAWPLLPPGFLDRAKASASGLIVPWAPQDAVLRHASVGAFVTHAGWGSVTEAMSGGVPMMNARAVERLWCFGTVLDEDAPMTRGGVAKAVASVLAGEEGVRMRARARDLQARVVEAFGHDGGSTSNFNKFVEIVCAAPILQGTLELWAWPRGSVDQASHSRDRGRG